MILSKVEGLGQMKGEGFLSNKNLPEVGASSRFCSIIHHKASLVWIDSPKKKEAMLCPASKVNIRLSNC